MANGDTKTEAMLNVLGNGGSGDEFRGCCNTKTQKYILDAIDRINSLDPGGGGGSTFTVLTDADANYTDPNTGEEYIALWLLPTGKYALAEDATIGMLVRLVDGAPSEVGLAENHPVAFITNPGEGSGTDMLLLSSLDSIHATVEYDTGISNEFYAMSYPFTGTNGVEDGTGGLVPAPTAFDANKFLQSDGVWGAAVTLSQLDTRLDNMTLLKITQTAYDQLQTKDPDTLYVITGA